MPSLEDHLTEKHGRIAQAKAAVARMAPSPEREALDILCDLLAEMHRPSPPQPIPEPPSRG